MMTLVKRHLNIYFSNKVAVFFSLLGAWIAFTIYLFFLRHQLEGAFSHLANGRDLLDKWVMAGILAISGISTTATVMAQLVKDKEKNRYKDFLLGDLVEWRLQASYLLAGMLVGWIMQLIVFLLMTGYFYLESGMTFSLKVLIALLGQILLNGALWSILFCMIYQWIGKRETASQLLTLIGTSSGFLVGVYMPIGALSAGVQNVLKGFPGLYIASNIRQILLDDSLKGIKADGDFLESYLGVTIFSNDHFTSLWQNHIIITSTILLAGVMLYLVFKKKKKESAVHEIFI